jgi:hypothetical protein
MSSTTVTHLPLLIFRREVEPAWPTVLFRPWHNPDTETKTVKHPPVRPDPSLVVVLYTLVALRGVM